MINKNIKTMSVEEHEAIKYMENVLKVWKGFCKGHKTFTNNLNIILNMIKENENELGTD